MVERGTWGPQEMGVEGFGGGLILKLGKREGGLSGAGNHKKVHNRKENKPSTLEKAKVER